MVSEAGKGYCQKIQGLNSARSLIKKRPFLKQIHEQLCSLSTSMITGQICFDGALSSSFYAEVEKTSTKYEIPGYPISQSK